MSVRKGERKLSKILKDSTISFLANAKRGDTHKIRREVWRYYHLLNRSENS